MSIPGLHGVPVVVADNDAAAAGAVSEALRVLGLAPMVCTSLREMFTVLKPARRAVIFLDLNIDGVDCFDLLAKMAAKAEASGRRYVILAMSSYGGPNVALSVVRAGAFRFFTKPARGPILETLVREAAEELTRPLTPVRPATEEVSDDEGLASPPSPARVAATAAAERAEARAPEVAVSEVSSGERAVDGGTLFPMDRMTVVRTVPDEPGVVTFFDADRSPVAVEFCNNMCQRLRYYVDLHAAVSELARTARWFEVLATQDRGQEAKVFDRLVNQLGHFPPLMKEAPEGSEHVAPPPLGKRAERDGRVTQHRSTSDPALVARIRKLLAERPTDPRVQDWLGYTLYSNDMLDEAIEFYTELITKGSRRDEHFFYCANALWKTGDRDRSIKLWRMASLLSPDSPIGRKSAARLDLAMAGKDPALTVF